MVYAFWVGLLYFESWGKRLNPDNSSLDCSLSMCGCFRTPTIMHKVWFINKTFHQITPYDFIAPPLFGDSPFLPSPFTQLGFGGTFALIKMLCQSLPSFFPLVRFIIFLMSILQGHLVTKWTKTRLTLGIKVGTRVNCLGWRLFTVYLRTSPSH